MTFIGIQYAGTGPNPKDPSTGTRAAANALLHDWDKSVSNLFLKVDGVSIPGLGSDLVKTGFFDMGQVQPGSLADAYGLTGELNASKSEGYFAVLKGFSSGDHTIEFGGSAVNYDRTPYTIDVVDHIRVV